MAKDKEKLISAKEVNEFQELMNEAAEISPEAVNYIVETQYFTRKGKTCERSTASLRKLLYKKYPDAKKYTEKVVEEKREAIIKAALEKAQNKKSKPKKAAKEENTNSQE